MEDHVLHRSRPVRPRLVIPGVPEDPRRQRDLVAQNVVRCLPQGRPASREDQARHELPQVLPDPLQVGVGERLCILILASQERGWVSINHLLLFE